MTTKTSVTVPVLHYQKHRRGCPCLSCDEMRRDKNIKRLERLGTLLWIVFGLGLAAVLIVQVAMVATN